MIIVPCDATAIEMLLCWIYVYSCGDVFEPPESSSDRV